MNEKLETIFDYEGDDGRTAVVAVDHKNRLYVNGEPIVTESKLSLDWWVATAAVIAGVSALTLAIIEVGRVLGWWTSIVSQ